MHPKYVVFGATVVVALGLDQATKRWVVANLEQGVDEIVLIPNFMSIVHAQNTGAAFSAMEGMNPLFFLAFTLIATVIIVDLLRRQAPTERMVPLTLGLIFSGAVGNAIDRVIQGHVTDMIKNFAGFEPARSWLIERFGTNVWPIYNIADSVLLIGVFAFLLYYLLQGDSDPLLDDDEPSTEAA